MSEITNPYRPGEPVTDPAWLFGRQDAADWVELQIAGKAHVLVLSAPPHIGKTSFIKHVGKLQAVDTYNVVMTIPETLAITLSQPIPQKLRARGKAENELITLDMVLEPLIEQLLPQLALHRLISSEQAATYLSPTASALRELFTQVNLPLNKPLVLYIDDLHHLVHDDMAVLATFLSTFMPILDECPQLYLVFTVNDKELRQIRHPLLDGAPTFHLSTLPPDASATMITLPVKNILRFDYGITRRIAETNSHHPYYLALFCHTLLNRQGHDGWVNQRDFDAALSEILDTPIAPFSQIWDESSWIERAVLASMGAMQGKHGPVMEQEVMRSLQSRGNAVVPEVVIEALKTLAERRVLVPMGAISYRFHVELLRFWLREHTQPDEILKEVDWSRLAAQVRLKAKKDRAISPPIASQGRRSQLGRRRVVWSLLIGFLAILCVAITGAGLAIPYLGIPLTSFISNPTPILLESAEADAVGLVEAAATTNSDSPSAPTPAGPSPTATPTPALVVARTLPSIVYMARDIDQSWQIYLMNADGSAKELLSEEGLDDTTPVWSPNGQQIALVSRRDGNREIYIMDVNTKEAVNITRHPADDWTPAWSPDGSLLAFSSIREGRWEIFTVDTTCFGIPETCRDSLIQITADGNNNISPVWSPDGTRFAYNGKASGNWDIYTMASNGSNIRPVTTAIENDLSPAWSPDGSRIAFESNREGNVEIYVVDSTGAGPVQNITNLSFADDHGPTWSPDGQTLVFYSNREGNWDIFSISFDGQILINLTQTPSRDEQTPAWRP